MINIETNTTFCTVMIPRTLTKLDDTVGDYILTFTGCTSRAATVATITSCEVKGEYYDITFRLSSALTDGEYRYTLTKGLATLAEGILRVGEVGSAVTPAETPNKITYTTAK